MYKKKIIFYLSMMVVALFATTSCSEDDGNVEEYPDWHQRNVTYFDNLTDSVQKLIASGRTDWKRIRTWAKGDGSYLTNADYILVRVLSDAPATETASTLDTDSVSVRYSGRLLPSTSYPSGLRFDASFQEPFDPDIAVATKFSAGGVVDGFSTALQNMRRGDRWEVYMPYQLGYGESGYQNIPGYSVLIFDIGLKDFWSK